ncbi:DNAase [Burkholderia ubonensis]|uniref:TatD family hydrolase n=1 Tax=Burkholderia ubonensis TaxID=101571 RepID=UPI000752D107|nr:TatD family hydrolase [Burkholderia ubonensis]KVO77166.1 DNAase [Burkholderia ubonensis]KVT84125.1 DNAase [Burkholderia ubonensis]KVZ06421.1 DNAase [Burkholderia ubonensis]KWB50468.1 DNAase [Burkholderia ubonensis]KWE72989.1 DNAase [Burkholderia ubonensis]
MWIDTHCHLDAAEFDADRDAVAQAARDAGVARIVIPSVGRDNFATVRELAHRTPGAVYALGIHPMYTPHAHDGDLDRLRMEIEASLDDPRFVAIGEIGLDYFVPGLDEDRQQFFYQGQLKLAREFDLPVLCHVRKSQDRVLAGLRRFGVRRGIAHAFNGSFQQADAYLAQGLHLGFGGNVTFTRALQIRRLATQLPIDALVVETDAPDIAPEWAYQSRNTPAQVPRIGGVLAELRGIDAAELALCTSANARAALPRLALSSA